MHVSRWLVLGEYVLGLLAGLLFFVSVFPIGSSSDYTAPQSKQFVANYNDTALHAAFFHNIGGITDNLRSSDIILFGSSKMLYGVDVKSINDAWESRGVRFFQLGIPGGETLDWLVAFVKRQKISKKILMLTLDDNTLSSFSSAYMREALRMNWLEAAVRYYGVYTQSEFDRWLDELSLPKLSASLTGFSFSSRNGSRSYRDYQDGAQANPFKNYTKTVPMYVLTPSSEISKRLNRRDLEQVHFKEKIEFLKSRGFSFLFTVIPYGTGPGNETNFNPELSKVAAELYGGLALKTAEDNIFSTDAVHVATANIKVVTDLLKQSLEANSEAILRQVSENRKNVSQSNSQATNAF